jgi:cytochrome bd ubiquinol oxidase subunit II
VHASSSPVGSAWLGVAGPAGVGSRHNLLLRRARPGNWSPRRALLSRGLPMVVLSGACGVAALLLLRRAAPRLVQVLAVGAVAAVIAGWGVAQYPDLLGTHTTIGAAAAPEPTIWALTVVAAVAVAIVVPSMALLFVLAERGSLESSS